MPPCSFPVRWDFMADNSLNNIGAWVNKKVPELVGMEEPDLVEFIMGHVRNHAPAGEHLVLESWCMRCGTSTAVRELLYDDATGGQYMNYGLVMMLCGLCPYQPELAQCCSTLHDVCCVCCCCCRGNGVGAEPHPDAGHCGLCDEAEAAGDLRVRAQRPAETLQLSPWGTPCQQRGSLMLSMQGCQQCAFGSAFAAVLGYCQRCCRAFVQMHLV